MLNDENFFKTVAETANDAILNVDDQNLVVYANPAVEKIFGYRPSDLVGHSILPLLHEGLRNNFSGLLDQHLSGHLGEAKGHFFEFVGLHKNKREIFLEASFREFTAEGRRFFCGVLRDVTVRKRADHVLRENEERLRMLDEVTEEAIILHDQGVIVDANRAVAGMLGYEIEELVGKHLSKFMDQGSMVLTKTHLEKGYPEGSYEITAKRKNGTTFPLEVQGRDFVFRGRKLRVSSGWDVSFRKRIEQAFIESEGRLRRFAEVTKEGILIASDNVMVDVNQALLNMTGYSTGELLGKDGINFLDEESAAKAKRLREEGKTDGPYEVTIRRKDGGFFPAELRSRNFLFEGKKQRVVTVWDITERKRSEEALKVSEEKFRSFIENSYDVFCVMKSDSTIQYISPSVKKVLGFDPTELMGKQGLGLLHPEDLSIAEKALQKIVPVPGAAITVEMRHRHKDGSWRSIEITAVNLLDNPAVQGIVLNNRDVTDKKQAEEALRHSEESFRNLIENSNDVISLVGADGKARYVSPSIKKVMGYDPEERIGHSFLELVHPEDQPRVMELFREFAYKPGVTVSSEARAKHKNGTWRHVEAVATNLLNHPGIRGIIFNYRDITGKKLAEEALKISEENFRMLIEKSPDAMVVHRVDKIYYVNPAFLKLLGYEKAEELIGRSPEFMMPPEEREKIIARIQKLNQGERYNPPVERRVVKKNGEMIPLEVVSFSIVFQGELMVVAVMRDLTERKNSEKALMKFERLSTIGEMAAGLAHEIRNPLASISTAAQLLGRKLTKEGKKDDSYISTILEQSERLEQLVRDTMVYARAEKDLPKDPFPLKPALEAALRLCQVQFGPSHAKIKVEWDLPKKDLKLFANPQRIQQILINLILNAYQVMPEGGKLKISMRSLGDSAFIRVEDSGPGIKDEDVNRVFEPFFTTKGGGSGLGLAISQKIAGQYGGKISFERLFPRGTAFTFEVPMGSKAEMKKD